MYVCMYACIKGGKTTFLYSTISLHIVTVSRTFLSCRRTSSNVVHVHAKRSCGLTECASV